jgi:hypothetical protein
MDASTPANPIRWRWSLTSAALGGLAWLMLPSIPAGAPLAFGSLEHVFTFAPLTAVPLARLLAVRLLRNDSGLVHAHTPIMGRIHRWVAVGALAGIPLIFVSKLVSSSAVKFLGVSSIVVSIITFALIAATVSFRLISPIAKRFMLASAASILFAMIVAGAFGVGEVLGRSWISVPQMVEYHGLLERVACEVTQLASSVNDQSSPVRQSAAR